MAALSRLPRRQREVLVLRYYADLNVDEIAAHLADWPSAVRLHRIPGYSRAGTSISGG